MYKLLGGHLVKGHHLDGITLNPSILTGIIIGQHWCSASQLFQMIKVRLLDLIPLELSFTFDDIPKW